MIDVGTLRLTKAHRDKVMKALKSNRLSYGDMTSEFEKRFSKLHSNKHGVMTNSGTSALQATLHAMKILYGWKDGDEIIIPATTFVATIALICELIWLVDISRLFNEDSAVVLNRLNIAKHGGSYSSRKKRPKKYGNPFSGFTLANFVKAWWEQPGKKINLWKRQNRLFSLP